MTFIVLGFVIMVLVQLIEGEHDHIHGHEEYSICKIDPSSAFKDITSNSINVTCIDGNFTIM